MTAEPPRPPTATPPTVPDAPASIDRSAARPEPGQADRPRGTGPAHRPAAAPIDRSGPPGPAGNRDLSPVITASLAPPPRRRAVPLSREQILAATGDCLVELGYDGTTIRVIARRLGCAVGSIYRYFDDKRDLLGVVTQRRFEPVADAIERGETIAQTSAAYHRVAARDRQMYALMLWLSAVVDPARSRPLPVVIERIIRGWGEQLGSRDAGERHWADIHGALMLGRDAPIAAGPSPAPSRPTPQARPAPPGPRDDVTLL